MPNLGYEIQGAQNGSIGGATLQAFIMPENGTFDSMSMYVGLDFGAGRAALYAGGTSDTDPTGATLVEDLGLIPNGEGWQVMPSSGAHALTQGTRYWVAAKSNDDSAFRIARDPAPGGGVNALGDFADDSYRTTGEDADETVAWSSAIAAGTLTNQTNTYSWYITYTADGGGDATAPSLSSASATATGSTTADGSVSTDEGNGTLYFVVTTSSTAPSVAQVQAGQDHTGAAAVDSGSQAVSGTGVQNITGGFTGLAASTVYYAHYQHQDAATNDSTVVSSASFTTDAPPAGGVVGPLLGSSHLGSRHIGSLFVRS